MATRTGWLIVLALCCCTAAAVADVPAPAPAPDRPALQARAATRYPQPVRVGDLIDRYVLEPTPEQHVLGRVGGVVRAGDGGLDLVLRYGGVLGIGARPVAVPIEAVALLGEHVVVMDLTTQQLAALPTAADGTRLQPDDIIRVALTKPFH